MNPFLVENVLNFHGQINQNSLPFVYSNQNPDQNRKWQILFHQGSYLKTTHVKVWFNPTHMAMPPGFFSCTDLRCYEDITCKSQFNNLLVPILVTSFNLIDN